MKKRRVSVLLAISIVSMLVLSSCANNNSDNQKSLNSTTETGVTETSDRSADSNVAYKETVSQETIYEESAMGQSISAETYPSEAVISTAVETAENDDVSINDQGSGLTEDNPGEAGVQETAVPFPVFDNASVDQLIQTYVGELESLYSGLSSVNYQIMYQDENYISLLYTGEVTGAAYPRPFKSTLNINVSTGTRMTLAQIASINDSFVQQFKSAVELGLNEMGVGAEIVFPAGVEQLLPEADTSVDVQSYFTSDVIVIILSVQHALGDYMEISIPVQAAELSIQ